MNMCCFLYLQTYDEYNSSHQNVKKIYGDNLCECTINNLAAVLTIKFMSIIIAISQALLSIKIAFVNYIHCYLVLYANTIVKD